jgi:hypothetical protein
MKGLKIGTLSILIGLAILIQFKSATYVHAGGIRTPQPRFTLAQLSSPPPTGMPTGLHFGKNTPIASTKDLSDPTNIVTPNTPPSTKINPSISTSTIAPLNTSPVSPSQQAIASLTSLPLTIGTTTVQLPSGTSTLIGNSSTLTASSTSDTEPDKVREPTPKRPSITAGPTEIIQTPDGTLEPEKGKADEPTLLEIRQQISDNTDIVILNANGKSEPLVTQAAADMITEG